MSTSARFRVHCFGFKARDLPAKDRCGTSDPYFRGDFDKYKTFKSEWIARNCSPVWKHEIRFVYETRFANKLDKKSFKIEVWDHDKIGADNFIGSVSVDLKTLATGPVEHDLLLRDGTKPAGRIQFCVVMEQLGDIRCCLKQVAIEELRDAPADYQLVYYFSGKRDRTCKSMIARATAHPTWEELEMLQFEATLREVVIEGIVIEIRKVKGISGNEDKIAASELRLSKYVVLVENELVRFSEPVLATSGTQIGTIQGIVTFSGIPQFAQMKAGKHTEDGIIGGVKLREDLPGPANIVQRTDLAAPHGAPAAGGSGSGSGGTGPTPTPAATPAATSPAGDSGGMYPTLPGATGAAPTGSVGSWAAAATPAARMQAAAFKAAASHNFATSVGATTPQSSAIPAGWVEKEDPMSGRKFYVNTVTGESRWEMPATAEDAAAENEFTGSTTEQQMEAGLPDGWIEQKDPASGRTFYVHTPTGQTQWDRPEVPSAAGSPTPGRRASGTFPAQPVVAPTPAQPIAPAPVTGAPAGLPTGWIEQKDPASGRPFYVYTPTGQTQWDRPAAPSTAMPAAGGAAPAAALPSNPLPRTRAGSYTASGQPTAATPSTGLPTGWIEQRDPASGRPFYVYTPTGTRQWERPSAPATPSPAVATPTPAAAPSGLPTGWIEQRDPASGRPFYVYTPTGQTQWDRPAAAATGSPTSGRRASGSFPAQPVVSPTPAVAPAGLPTGWIEQRDPASGRPFYVYTPTGQTQWERPTAIGGAGAGAGGVASATQPKAAPTGLPTGWIEQRDPASGRQFYVYTPTGQTQWNHPGAASGIGGAVTSGQLPPGWIQQEDPATRLPSYLNLATGQRQSFPPQMSPSYIPHH